MHSYSWKWNSFRVLRALFLVAGLWLTSVSRVTAALSYTTVIVGGRPSGDPLGPQLGGVIDWKSTFPARIFYINAAGQVAFGHELDDSVPSIEDKVLYRWTNGTKELLARENRQAIGQPAGVNNSVLSSIFHFADDGSLLYRPNLKDGGVTTANDAHYIYISPTNAATVVLREGSTGTAPPPGIPGATFINSGITDFAPALAPTGQIMFGLEIAGSVTPDNNFAYFYGLPGTIQLLARKGDLAPHAGAGVRYGPAINPADLAGNFAAAGDYLSFEMNIVNPNSTIVDALHYGHLGTLSLLAKGGDAAPGVAGTFDTFDQQRINAAGKVSFTSRVNLGGGVFANGIFATKAGGGIEVLGIKSIPAAGTGVNFAQNPGPDFTDVEQSLTASGSIAFSMYLEGAGVTLTNDTGIWINDASGTRLAMREGDAAGNLNGVTLGKINSFALNDNQNLVVLTELVGSVTAVNNQALWVVRPNGGLELLLRKGDLFDVDPSAGVDARTIGDIFLGGHTDLSDGEGKFGTFNDLDQLVFGIEFTEGPSGQSGIFVADLTVPEPTSISLMTLAGAALLTVIRRRTG